MSQSKLDKWQADVLSSNSRRLLMNCCRQSGKSHTSSLKASYRAVKLGRTQIIIAPTLRQSSVIFNRVLSWLRNSQTPVPRQTATTIYLSNGAIIHCLPGDRPDFVRGLTGHDLIIDEASRIKPSLIAAVTPIVATIPDSSITMLTTPAGKIGTFYKEWISDEIWTRVKISAEQCPRISKEFLREERIRLGEVLYSQEYECEFISSSMSLLDPEAIAKAFIPPLSSPVPRLSEDSPLWVSDVFE